MEGLLKRMTRPGKEERAYQSELYTVPKRPTPRGLHDSFSTRRFREIPAIPALTLVLKFKRMRRLSLAFALLLSPCPAWAEVLTCDVFKNRIDQTVRDMGGLVAPPGALKQSYDGGAETGKRFEWTGDVGIAGTMTCGKTGAFEDFGIAIDEAARTSDSLGIALDRFMELASASVCALSDAPANDCRALVKTMTAGSLAQFRDAVAKGDAVPTGTRDFVIVDGVDAELDMTPVGITWSIGPGRSATTEAGKRALKPRNLDQ